MFPMLLKRNHASLIDHLRKNDGVSVFHKLVKVRDNVCSCEHDKNKPRDASINICLDYDPCSVLLNFSDQTFEIEDFRPSWYGEHHE